MEVKFSMFSYLVNYKWRNLLSSHKERIQQVFYPTNITSAQQHPANISTAMDLHAALEKEWPDAPSLLTSQTLEASAGGKYMYIAILETSLRQS